MAVWIEDAGKDIRFALRQLRKAPGFTAVAILSLALGIGANAAIFTLIDAVLVKSLPVRDPQGLVLVGDARGRGVGVGVPRSLVVASYDLYTHLRDADVFEQLCAVQSSEDRIAVRRGEIGGAHPATARFVSGNYFQVLGVDALAGRTIEPPDDAPAARPVAVVSHRYWKSALNQNPATIGSTIDINGVPVTIVGVAPPDFYGERIEPDPPAFWVPIAASRQLKPQRNLIDEPDQHWLYLIGRLKPGVTAAQAQSRSTLTLQNWLRDRAGSPVTPERRARIADRRVELTAAGSGIPHMRRSYAETLRLLLGISMAVLLIACANIAGLLLARGTARRAERSLRLALGATRGRLIRQSLTESLMLAMAGGALALPVAAVATTLLLRMTFGDAAGVPIQTTPDGRVLVFTFALSCTAALVFGTLPAMRLQSDLVHAMKGVRFRLGKALIVGEVAVSLVVLAAAGSLARSLANVTSQPFGFDRSHVLIVNVDAALARYDLARLGPLYQQLQARLNSLPGVTSASLSHYSPFNGCCWAFSVTVPGYTRRPDESTSAMLNRVSPRYFETLGTTVLRGRAIDEHDTATSRRVAVVSDAFAQRFFPNADPIGRLFTIDSEGRDAPREIVGVVADAKYDQPRDEQRPMAYLPLLQMRPDQPQASGDYQSNFVNAIEVRASGDPTEIAGMVRRALSDIDPGLPVLSIATLSDQVSQTLRQEQTIATLAACFGVLALALSWIGLYGLMAYLVQRRTSEIGIRIALGARRAAVMAMVIREALEQAAIGILIGVPITFGLTRLIANQLYGVSPTDPKYAAAAAVVLVVSLGAAGYLPSRRASRIDPIRALRHD